jgi:hypothetical protein
MSSKKGLVRKRTRAQKHPVNAVIFADAIKRTVTPTRVADPTIGYSYNPSKRKSGWASPEYNLAEIGRVSDVESYVRQAFGKKIALMFKEGWDFVGKNPKTVEYVKLRLRQIADATSTPTLKLFRDIGTGLIQKSNVFLIKVRDLKASGGKLRKAPGSKRALKPVAGYFVAPAETIEFRMTGNSVVKWRQRLPDGYNREFAVEDTIHMYCDRKDGFVFGTPLLIPVIDDIRALRKIEENIELLIYQHLFPLFQWKVGTEKMPAGLTEGGEREVDIVKREIQYMPTEGGIVTTERHDITAVGAEGRALRAESYLTHFKRRVFAGLGISAMDAGESESANRSTSETLSQNLIDSVKDYQQVVEIFINEYIIKELLLESNFKLDVLSIENEVWLKFKEIDVDYQIKKEAHSADQFNKEVINLHEARIAMGREPIALPTYEEIDAGRDGRDQYPDWYAMHWALFGRPKALINAVDEPYSDISKARTAAEAARKEELAVKKTAAAKKPAVTKKKVKNAITDAALVSVYKRTKKEIVSYISEKQQLDEKWIGQLIRASVSTSIDKIHNLQVAMFRKGYAKFGSTRSDNFINALTLYRSSLRTRIEKYVDKLINDTVEAVQRNIDPDMSRKDAIASVINVFDSFSYRTRFIEDAEIRKAFSFGKVIGMRHLGLSGFTVDLGAEACDKCHARAEEIVQDTFLTSLDDVPPFHAHCNCKINFSRTVKSFSDMTVEDEVQDYGRKKKKNPAVMANCIRRMMTRLKKNDLGLDINELEAMARSMCENIVKNKTDSGKLERCVLKVKKSLRKSHPDWSAEKIKTSAFKICNSRLK